MTEPYAISTLIYRGRFNFFPEISYSRVQNKKKRDKIFQMNCQEVSGGMLKRGKVIVGESSLIGNQSESTGTVLVKVFISFPKNHTM
ncbi:MAG: hypothetical protein HXS47_10605 [Theionarchaea archaeon]|nr:hypothetical protein [Theionarchaea archaeon]